MKHPSWCEQDDCEEGWHKGSVSYTNNGLARIEVRITQEVETGKFELDLGDTNGSFNTYEDAQEIENELSELREFAVGLKSLLDATKSK